MITTSSLISEGEGGPWRMRVGDGQEAGGDRAGVVRGWEVERRMRNVNFFNDFLIKN